jgi:cell shape-determining protein MreC
MCEILLSFIQKLGAEVLFNIMCVFVGFIGAFIFFLLRAPKVFDKCYHDKTKAVLESYENRVNEIMSKLETLSKNINGFYDLRRDYERIAGENAELHRRLRKARERISKSENTGGRIDT